MTSVIEFEPNTSGRDFVCGDIHGCFDTVEHALKELHYDPLRDRLFALGDLIDYGQRSEDALEWIESRFTATVRGNHEQSMLDWLARRRPRENEQLRLELARVDRIGMVAPAQTRSPRETTLARGTAHTAVCGNATHRQRPRRPDPRTGAKSQTAGARRVDGETEPARDGARLGRAVRTARRIGDCRLGDAEPRGTRHTVGTPGGVEVHPTAGATARIRRGRRRADRAQSSAFAPDGPPTECCASTPAFTSRSTDT